MHASLASCTWGTTDTGTTTRKLNTCEWRTPAACMPCIATGYPEVVALFVYATLELIFKVCKPFFDSLPVRAVRKAVCYQAVAVSSN